MKKRPRLRVRAVRPNANRLVVSYEISNGCEVICYFVGNIRGPWQQPHCLYLHSVWLLGASGREVLAGVLHNPAATEVSSDCYFYGRDAVRQVDLLGYLTLLDRRVRKTWGGVEGFEWLDKEATLKGWRELLRRLEVEDIPPLHPDLVSGNVPRIS